MLVCNIGICAFDPTREIGTNEQIEDAVDAVGGNSAPLSFRDLFGDVIGARRLAETRQSIEHSGAHPGPLFTLQRQAVAGRSLERFAFVKLMVVLGHDLHVMR